MAAATADRNTVRRNGLLHNLAILAATALYAGTLICRDSDGYAKDGADTAGLVFAGVASAAQDNSDGEDGDKTIDVYADGEFKFTSSGLVDDDVGQPVYIIDNQTVGLAGNASVDNYVYVGIISEVVSSTECWVRIDGQQQPEPKQYVVEIVGVDTTAFDLSTAAADFGGSDFDVADVQSIVSYVTSTGALDSLKALTTDYTVAAGAITTVADETLNTWVIHFTGYLVP